MTRERERVHSCTNSQRQRERERGRTEREQGKESSEEREEKVAEEKGEQQHSMGGQSVSSLSHDHCHSQHLSSPGPRVVVGGGLFAELDHLGRAFPSSFSFSCCCCCHRRCLSCCTPSSEPELDDHATSSSGSGVNDDDGSDGAPSGGHGGPLGGGEARSSNAAGCDRMQEEGEPPDEGSRNSSAYSEEEMSRWRQRRTYLEFLRSYRDGASERMGLFQDAKDAILRYTPGKWIERVGGMTRSKYDVPSTTTLLLVGPQGSGKSALVNRISKLLEDNPSLPDRAQVFHNISTVEGTYSTHEYTIHRGTYFLQEYMIPRDSASFCVYDTRGLSKVASENSTILKRWMNKGVRHGEMVLRDKDCSFVKSKLKAMARDMQRSRFVRRRVNFVIFVIDGISVLKTIHSLNKDYTNMLVETFNYPFMSFKDNKPAVVVTHGDLLSFHERALVCTHLGELLGIPATKQIFDIPDLDCPTTKLAIVDLLHYSLEQADRNVPLTSDVLEGTKLLQWMVKQFQDFETWIVTLELLFIFICASYFLHYSW